MINNLANSFTSLPLFGLRLGVFTVGAVLFFVLVLAVVALKGYALWNAAKREDKGWFVAILIINTFGVLELVYLYFVVGKWKQTKPAENTTTPPPAPTPSAQ